MPVHTNRNVEVGLATQDKSSYVTMIHVNTIPIFPRTLALLSHTCTCTSRWIVPRRAITLLFPLSTITPFSWHNHVELSCRCVASCRTLVVDLSVMDTGAIFNEPKTCSLRRHSKTQEHTLRLVFDLRFRFTTSLRMCASLSARIKGFRCVVTWDCHWTPVVVTPTMTDTYCGYVCYVWRVCVISSLKYLPAIFANRKQPYSQNRSIKTID